MKIDGKTQKIGLLGWPVSHTKSPIIHNAVIEAHNLNFAYLPLPVHPKAVEAAVKGLPALGFLGVNVTAPHKQAVMPLLDEIDPAASAIGAVNTILFQENEDQSYPPKSIGFNTDWIGFQQDLEAHGVPYAGRDCLVIGAGGSARSVIYSLINAQANVHLCARRKEQADGVVSEMLEHVPDAKLSTYDFGRLGEVLETLNGPLIVHTTPVGMHPHVEQTVWPDDVPFPAGSFVYDLIYTPVETQLMRQAQAAGCGVLNGLGMLLGQGAESFRIWTGVQPDIALMSAAL